MSRRWAGFCGTRRRRWAEHRNHGEESGAKKQGGLSEKWEKHSKSLLGRWGSGARDPALAALVGNGRAALPRLALARASGVRQHSALALNPDLRAQTWATALGLTGTPVSQRGSGTYMGINVLLGLRLRTKTNHTGLWDFEDAKSCWNNKTKFKNFTYWWMC